MNDFDHYLFSTELEEDRFRTFKGIFGTFLFMVVLGMSLAAILIFAGMRV
jgi:uncharacterized membrane protein YqjE